MENKTARAPALCPKCGRTYTARPSVSRTDGTTLICPDCGTLEALESLGVSEKERQKILDTIHQYCA